MTTATRDVILRTIRSQGKCTVKELAVVSGVSPVSVRHHLNNLQSEGLLSAEEVRHGVGRPHLMYSLTEEALELFPSRYLRLTNRLLGEIKDSMPRGKVQELFSAVAATMAEEYAITLKGLPLEERVYRLVHLLEEEGFDTVVEWEGDNLVLRELSCPYLRISVQHPEVCGVDQEFIATALSLPVERITCLLDGDTHCSFKVEVDATPEEISAYER